MTGEDSPHSPEISSPAMASQSSELPNVSHQRPLTMPGLIAIIYYSVCGGPFGSEDIVSAAGPLFALLGFVIMPLIWSIPEALVAAELSTVFPTNSGYTTWVTAAFGPFWGFMEGFLSWLAGVTDSAIYPVLLADYLKHIFPEVGEGLTGYLFVTLLAVALTLINFRGLNIVGWSALVLAVFTISPFFYIVPVAFANMEPRNLLIVPKSLSEIEWTSYLNVLFWNLNYWDSASCVAGEVHEPRKTFPRALFFAAIFVFASYLLPLAAGIGLSGPGGGSDWKSWHSGTLATLGMRTGGDFMKAWVVLAAAVSNIGQFVSEQAECAFQIQGMANKGWLPTCMGRRSCYETPTVGILICLLIVLALATFDFSSIVDLLNGIYCMAQLLEFAAFLKLRYSYPDIRRPFSVPLKSTAACAVMLFLPMLFCTIMLLLPVFKRDWFQVLVFVCAPVVGIILNSFLELCRHRRWARFTCEPPRDLDAIMACQTPVQRMLDPDTNPQVFHLPPAVQSDDGPLLG